MSAGLDPAQPPSYQDLVQAVKALEGQRDDLVNEIMMIRIALGTVTVYEGLVDVSPVAMMVQQLCSDHEGLEGRIEAILVEAKSAKDAARRSDPMTRSMDRIIHLARGGSAVPDTIQEMFPDG